MGHRKISPEGFKKRAVALSGSVGRVLPLAAAQKKGEEGRCDWGVLKGEIVLESWTRQPWSDGTPRGICMSAGPLWLP